MLVWAQRVAVTGSPLRPWQSNRKRWKQVEWAVFLLWGRGNWAGKRHYLTLDMAGGGVGIGMVSIFRIRQSQIVFRPTLQLLFQWRQLGNTSGKPYRLPVSCSEAPWVAPSGLGWLLLNLSSSRDAAFLYTIFGRYSLTDFVSLC